MNRVKRCRPLLGTFVEITIEDAQSEARLHEAIGGAFEVVGSVGSLMSFHDEESDVSRLNRGAHQAPVRVNPWTWRVIDHALKLSAATEGAFDITVAPQLVKWGYLPDHLSQPSADETARWTDIELQAGDHIFFRRPLQIDLGGIAKGFAVDLAIDHLSACGVYSAIVNAGGDLRVHGEGPREFAIRHPGAPQAEAVQTSMLRSAVATSAAYFSRKRHGSSMVNPIVHPHTGKPVRSGASVSVFSHTCLQADALTKVVLLAPEPLWNRILCDSDSRALLITKKGELLFFPA